MEIITKSPQETQKLAEKIAKDLLNYPHLSSPDVHRGKSKEGVNAAIVIALEGDLGGGKTTFAQGFAKGLGVKEKILSPTFVLIKKYKVNVIDVIDVVSVVDVEIAKKKKKRLSNHDNYNKRSGKTILTTLYHIDCYRINKAREISELDFEKIINNPKNIVVIEWAERIKNVLPKKKITIKFKWVSNNKRRITVINFQFPITNSQ